jgi:serine-type D-Ala-D-Ala carboxypeptidase/endopeptidase
MRRGIYMRVFFAIAAGMFVVDAASGQTPLTGDYTGTLGRQHLVLHILRDSKGTLTCAVDLSAERQYYEGGLSCADLVVADGVVYFSVPMLQGNYRGRISSDGKTLAGAWKQTGKTVGGERNEGESDPLVLTRDEFVPAEKPSPVDGDWQGAIDASVAPEPIVIHVKSDRFGKEYVALDSPTMPNAFGMPCKNAVLKGDLFSFDIGEAHFGGKLSPDAKTITGVWEQGTELPALTLKRRDMTPKLSPVDGDWAGVLESKDGALHALMQIASDSSGKEYVVFASPDQHARHLEGANWALNGRSFSFEIPSIHGSYTGTLSADGNGIDGIWTQGQPLPLNFQRAPKGSAADGPIQTDLPRPPLSLTELHAQMDRELRPMVENPAFAGMSGIGIAVGVYKQGERAVWSYGAAKPDSLFEIGSVTDTFTGLILARMVAEGKVTLETPVRELLPPGMVAKPAGPEVTLLSLATFHSGMRHMLDDFHAADPANPLADFTARNVHAYLAKAGVGLKPNTEYDLSDASIALLGEALANKAGESYGKLLREQVLEPLHLEHTYLTVPPEEKKNALAGHDFACQPMRAWDFDAFAPNDGIWSNATDMLTYAAEQVEPPAGPLARAIPLQHELRSQTDDGTEHLFRIGIAWMFEPSPRNYFSLGQVGGFSSFIFFNTEQQVAGVVLFNRTWGWAENVGYRIEGLLEGRRAYPLVQLR